MRHLLPVLLATSLASASLPAQDAEAQARFRAAYAQATAAYEEADYEGAIAGYQEACEILLHPTAAYNLACSYALAGKPESALEWLGKAVDVGFDGKAHAASDPDFASIREREAFGEILERIAEFEVTATRFELELTDDPELQRVRWYLNLPEGHDSSHSYPILFALPPGPGTDRMVQAGLDSYWQAEAASRQFLVATVELQGQALRGRAKAVVDGVLTVLARDHGGDRQRAVVAGFSNGGIGAFIAQAESRAFQAVVGIPGAIPSGLEVEDLGDVTGLPVLMMVGEHDPGWSPTMEEQAEQLRAAGAWVTYQELEGQGHVLAVDPADLFDWIELVLE